MFILNSAQKIVLGIGSLIAGAIIVKGYAKTQYYKGKIDAAKEIKEQMENLYAELLNEIEIKNNLEKLINTYRKNQGYEEI